MITLKKNSGSQSGMKMKATLGRPEKLHSTQTALFFPNPDTQMDWKTCSISEYWFQTDCTAVRAYSFNCGHYVAWGSVLHSQIEGCWNGFFFNCLNLAFRVAFVLTYLCWGRACPVTLTRHPSKRCSWKKGTMTPAPTEWPSQPRHHLCQCSSHRTGEHAS